MKKINLLIFFIFNLLFCDLSSNIDLEIYPVTAYKANMIGHNLEIMIKTPFLRTLNNLVLRKGKISDSETALVAKIENLEKLEIKQFDPTKEKLFYKIEDKFIEFSSSKIEEIKKYSKQSLIEKYIDNYPILVLINLDEPNHNKSNHMFVVKIPPILKYPIYAIYAIAAMLAIGGSVLMIHHTYEKIEQNNKKLMDSIRWHESMTDLT